MPSRRALFRVVALKIAVLALALHARADEIYAVLSAAEPPYSEALEGFREEVGRPVHVATLGGGLTRFEDAKVIAAFGSEAALKPFPRNAAVIVCLAPGLSHAPGGRRTEVDMSPSPERLLDALKSLQPGLKSLGVLWVSESAGAYARGLEEASVGAGIGVAVRRLRGPEELADALRGLHGSVEALWLPPDPKLISRGSFEVLKDFSWSSDVPLYAPTPGLVALGGAASAAPSYRDIGRAAGRAARDWLEGRGAPPVVYPPADLVVNESSAREAGLILSEDILRKARRLP